MADKLRLVPCNTDNWRIYLQWCKERDAIIPRPSPNAIFIADDEGMVAGVCLYVTDGPWLFAEHAVSRPGLPLVDVDRALKMGVEAAKGVGAVMGKVVLTHIRDRYIARILENAGYHHNPVEVWYAVPGEVVEKEVEEELVLPERKNKVNLCESCGAGFFGDGDICGDCAAEENKKPKEPVKRKPKKKAVKKPVSARRKKGEL